MLVVVCKMKAQCEALRRVSKKVKPLKLGRYVYRSVLARQFDKYAHNGLKLTPTKNPYWGGDLGASSMGKVFFARTQKNAEYYGNILKRDAGRDREFVGTIRVPVTSALKKQIKPDEGSQVFKDVYATKPVSLKGAEVWSGFRWAKLTKDLCLSIASGEWDDDFGSDDEE